MVIETSIRVRYAETDAMGVVHHASYIVWLELGRSELLRMIGLPYTEIEARGYFVMLAELNVRYHAPTRYDDLVLLRTELTQLRSRQIRFSYQISLQQNVTPLINANSDHIIVSRETGRPARLPSDLLDRLRDLEK